MEVEASTVLVVAGALVLLYVLFTMVTQPSAAPATPPPAEPEPKVELRDFTLEGTSFRGVVPAVAMLVGAGRPVLSDLATEFHKCVVAAMRTWV